MRAFRRMVEKAMHDEASMFADPMNASADIGTMLVRVAAFRRAKFRTKLEAVMSRVGLTPYDLERWLMEAARKEHDTYWNGPQPPSWNLVSWLDLPQDRCGYCGSNAEPVAGDGGWRHCGNCGGV